MMSLVNKIHNLMGFPPPLRSVATHACSTQRTEIRVEIHVLGNEAQFCLRTTQHVYAHVATAIFRVMRYQ